MVHSLRFLVSLFTSSLRSRLSLQLEVAALRQQLSVYQLQPRRPRIAPADRLLWSILARLWSDWRRALFFVQPRTVTLWQKKRFRDQYLKALVASDFFVVLTATFKVLFVFLVRAHDRRRIVHFNVTEHPTAQ